MDMGTVRDFVRNDRVAFHPNDDIMDNDDGMEYGEEGTVRGAPYQDVEEPFNWWVTFDFASSGLQDVLADALTLVTDGAATEKPRKHGRSSLAPAPRQSAQPRTRAVDA